MKKIQKLAFVLALANIFLAAQGMDNYFDYPEEPIVEAFSIDECISGGPCASGLGIWLKCRRLPRL